MNTRTREDRERGNAVKDIRKAIERACKKAKVDKKVTPHLFRHSIACTLIDEGESLRTVQKYLGHASYHATWKIAQSPLTESFGRHGRI